MIDLPNVLALDDGARVTGIALSPYAYEHADCPASFVIHRVRFDDDVAPTEAVGALAAFLPAAVLTLAGVEPDGSAWGATVQMQQVAELAIETHAERPFPHALWEISTGAIERAQHLTGLNGDSVRYVFDESDLVRQFEGDGADADGWSAINLLVGLTMGMAMSSALTILTDAVDAPGLPYGERTEHIAEALHYQLRDWCAIYEDLKDTNFPIRCPLPNRRSSYETHLTPTQPRTRRGHRIRRRRCPRRAI